LSVKWSAAAESNRARRSCKPAARHLLLRRKMNWHPGGDSNTQKRVWNPLASPSATGAHVFGARVYQVVPPEHTNHILSKIWRKAGDSNAYVPKDSGLAGQWDTNYPSLPITYKAD
jgi:hypothetical protein